LEKSWEQVKSKNTTLKLSENARLQSKEQLRQGQSLLWPSLDATGARTYTWPDDGASRTLDQVEIAGQWVFWDGGKAWNALKAQNFRSNSLDAVQKDQELQLRLQVEKNFGQAQVAWISWQLAQQSLELSKARVQWVKDRLELGRASEFEFLRAQVDAEEDQALTLEAWRKTQGALQNLVVLWEDSGSLSSASSSALNTSELWDTWMAAGVPDSLALWPLVLPDKSFWGAWPSDSGRDLSSHDALLDSPKSWDFHPKWQALHAAKSTAAAQVQAAGANYWPQLSLKSARTWSDGQGSTGSGTSGWQGAWQLGAQAKWNLFRGGLDRSAQNQAHLELRAAEIRLNALEVELEESLFLSRQAVLRAKEQKQLASSRVRLATRALKLARAQWELGTLNALDLRSAQEQNLEAQVRWVQSAEELRLALRTYQILAQGRLD
jgi:outer membrane protein TolC